MTYEYDLATAEARESLLDALEALKEHTGALVVVGAQAVYERTKGLGEAEPTSTRDADIGIDPTLVAPVPLIGQAMVKAGFKPARRERPGIWSKGGMTADGRPILPTVDLIAPEVLAGAGGRGARLGEHGKAVVGRARGIEMALIDRSVMTLEPLGGDERAGFEVHVAGHGALLCAKAWKLADRIADQDAGRSNRVRSKDAADVWRLMASSDPRGVRETFDRCERHPRFGPTVTTGRCHLMDLFGPSGAGTALAVANLAGKGSDVAADICEWVAAFLDAEEA